MPGEFSLDPAILDLMDSGPSPAEHVPGLVDAIGKLPKKYRAIIDAVFYERIPKVELADRLGIHRTVVDRLLGEALEALRLHLEMGPVQAARRQRIRVVPVPRKPRSVRNETE